MTGDSVPWLATLALLIACVALAGCGGAAKPKATTTGGLAPGGLAGPAFVVPGSYVQFTATGLRPGGDVDVVLTPADRSTCCSIRIRASFHVSDNGTAVLKFVMPTYYRRCTAALVCKRIAWRPNEKVLVAASGYLQQANTAAVVAPPNE
jgi:hypothetical protein